METYTIYLPIIFSLIGLLFMYLKSRWVLKQNAGNEKMIKISKSIKEGALAFLKAEYKILSVCVIFTAVLLAFKGINEGSSWLVAVSFVLTLFLLLDFSLREMLFLSSIYFAPILEKSFGSPSLWNKR